LETALTRLRARSATSPSASSCCHEVHLTQLQTLYEVVLETTLDKRNFRKKILAMDLLVELDEVEQDVAHRAARLYRFDERKYRRLVKAGFDFQL